jgi:hypothetical protein
LQCSTFKALYGVDPFPVLTPTLKLTDHQESLIFRKKDKHSLNC